LKKAKGCADYSVTISRVTQVKHASVEKPDGAGTWRSKPWYKILVLQVRELGINLTPQTLLFQNLS
jgi:hypothetical protein